MKKTRETVWKEKQAKKEQVKHDMNNRYGKACSRMVYQISQNSDSLRK